MENRKNKILFISRFAEIGGAEIFLLDIINNLDRQVFQSVVVLPGAGVLAIKLKQSGVKVLYLKMSKLNLSNPMPFIKTVINIWRIARIERAAIVFAVNYLSNQYAVVSARLAGLPIVCAVYNVLDKRSISRTFLKFSDHIIVDSKATADVLLANGLASKKLQVILHEISKDNFLPAVNARINIRHSFGMNDEVFLIGIVGRINPMKGQDILINAFAKVLDVYDGCRLLIVGEMESEDLNFSDQAYIKNLRSLVEKLNISGKVFFTGYRNDMADVYEALDLLVSSSLSESFGKTILEAMILGKPVIAAKVGGVPELVIDGITGRLVSPGNISELARVILELINDRKLAARLGNNAKEYALKNFVGNNQQAKVEAILAKLLKTK